MRIFISAALPAEIKKKLAGLIDDLKDSEIKVRWVEAENLHLTLKFLGEVEENKLGGLAGIVERSVVGSGSFKAVFKGLGTFPEGKNPRVVWVGTAEGGDELCGLADRLEKNLSKAGFALRLSPKGFARGERAFTAHLTIGRVKEKKEGDKLETKMSKLKDQIFGEAIIDKICIMKSTLTPEGPIHETLKEVNL